MDHLIKNDFILKFKQLYTYIIPEMDKPKTFGTISLVPSENVFRHKQLK